MFPSFFAACGHRLYVLGGGAYSFVARHSHLTIDHASRGDIFMSRMAVVACMTNDHGASHPYNPGTEHVRFSPTRPDVACTKREAKREVFGEPQ